MVSKINRQNNFDFLRLAFAAFVIITHSYALSGIKECDWLCQITDHKLGLSFIGVKGFFIVSGYLILKSLERSNNIKEYFWKRGLRLFPALIVVLILTVFVLGPIVYESSTAYFKNKEVLTYFPNNLSLYRMQYGITGIFDNNPFKSTINGSLWTISYEFTMYLFIGLFFLVRNNRNLMISLLSVSFIICMIGNVLFTEQLKKYNLYINAAMMADLGAYFLAGSLLTYVNFNNRISNWILVICVIMLSGGIIFTDNYLIFLYLTFPFIVLSIGLKSTPVINDLGKKVGDLSYGVYIYAFPIQQLLVYYLKLNYLNLMVYSLGISLILAFLSWHLVEKRALKLKLIRI